MSEPVTLLVGLDPPEAADITPHVHGPVLATEVLPRVRLADGELLVADPRRWGVEHPVARVVYHAIYEFADDVRFLATLALWGGRCLPNPVGMLLARPRVQNLAIAKTASAFASLPRTLLPSGGSITRDHPTVAKWGEWHCGEGKDLFTGERTFPEPTLLEPFVEGDAVRVQVIGGAAWQIQLGGDDWKKSIHHASVRVTDPDPALTADVRRIMSAFKIEIGAADYIVAPDGTPHLSEFNHIPNVTQFPEVRAGYLDYVKGWLA